MIICPAEWQCIRDTVAKDHATKGLSGHADGILRDVFTGTHFVMHSIPGATATTRGTRPGDPIADILFNMAFKLVVLDARCRIQEASSLIWFGHPSPALDVTCASPIPDAGFAEVSFVDDIAYAIHSPSADGLIRNLQVVASCLHDAAFHRGLTINYQAGKTEAIVKLAGPGSIKTKQWVWHQLQGRLPVITEHGVQHLQLVHAYEDLGSYIQDHGIVAKDIQHRILQARRAFGQLSRPFYAKKNVTDATKAAVFSALHGVHETCLQCPHVDPGNQS